MGLCLFARVGASQVLVGPGESTESAFRREVRGAWFGWASAQEEGDVRRASGKIDEILKHAQKIGIRRLTDLAATATLMGRKEMLAGKAGRAQSAFDAAVRLDPDLPEAQWARVSYALSTRAFGELPKRVAAAVRASLTDPEARRVVIARGLLVLSGAVATVGAILILLVVTEGARRYYHDLVELCGRRLPGPLATWGALLLFLFPLALTFDLAWLALVLYAACFGYATFRQKVASAVGLVLVLPFFVLLDRTGYHLTLAASPILRGAESLRISRYDQRVLDDLEFAKATLADDVDVRFLLGRLYQALGQNDRATVEYSHGSRMSSSDSRCLTNRGNIHFVDGDFGAAKEDYLEALKRDSNNVYARFNLSLTYAETFNTVEAEETLRQARAIDPRLVEQFLKSPTLVKVVSMDYSSAEARRKVEALETDERARRIMGHYRADRPLAPLGYPLVPGALLALAAAAGIDHARRRTGRGYAEECQKCGRTFCRLCKPHGENPLMCSQCIHVYMKKDGVAIETKLQKVEEVKRRKSRHEHGKLALNLLLPGSAAFGAERIVHTVVPLAICSLGLWAAFGRDALAEFSRPSAGSLVLGTALWILVAIGGWILGQTWSRRS